jgi:cellulose synthase (UDP-forming)
MVQTPQWFGDPPDGEKPDHALSPGTPGQRRLLVAHPKSSALFTGTDPFVSDPKMFYGHHSTPPYWANASFLCQVDPFTAARPSWRPFPIYARLKTRTHATEEIITVTNKERDGHRARFDGGDPHQPRATGNLTPYKFHV